MGLSFGKILKTLRTNRKLSQEELADRLNAQYGTNLNKGMISKWENELGDPRMDSVRVLALFFDVSLDYLMGLEDKSNITTIAAHHDGEDWTKEELEEIEKFKEFVKTKRKPQE